MSKLRATSSTPSENNTALHHTWQKLISWPSEQHFTFDSGRCDHTPCNLACLPACGGTVARGDHHTHPGATSTRRRAHPSGGVRRATCSLDPTLRHTHKLRSRTCRILHRTTQNSAIKC